MAIVLVSSKGSSGGSGFRESKAMLATKKAIKPSTNATNSFRKGWEGDRKEGKVRIGSESVGGSGVLSIIGASIPAEKWADNSLFRLIYWDTDQ